jgi:hypothetical protein
VPQNLHIPKICSNFAADFDQEDGFDCLQPRKKNAKKSRKSKDKRQELKQPCGCFFLGEDNN